MKNIDSIFTPGKSTKNIKQNKCKSFGYQILGFGSSGAVLGPLVCDVLVVAGGGGGGDGS